MACYRKLKCWQSKRSGEVTFTEPHIGEAWLFKAMEVPCGQCIGCRDDHAKAWAIRFVHESKMHKENCVLTLSYNAESLPPRGVLRYRDVQLFMMRLRKKYPGVHIVSGNAGEYGSRNWRPHYHVVMCGWDAPDKVSYGKAGDGSPLWTSKILEKLWGHGFVVVGRLTAESAAYVAKYALTKVNGEAAKTHYLRCDDDGSYELPREFMHVSKGRRPKDMPPDEFYAGGVGGAWLKKFWSDTFPSDSVVVDGKEQPAPKYYRRKLKARNEALYDELKAKRVAKMEAAAADNTPARLVVKEEVHRARLGLKKARSL